MVGVASTVKSSPRLAGLDFLWLELTGKCNLQCVHCYAGSGPFLPIRESMAPPDWIAALDQGYALGCRQVQFIGGEPTLYRELPLLIEHAHRTGYRFIEVFTNGMHFSQHLKNAFVDYGVNLAFSVYSFEPEIHDSVTLQSGSLIKTIASLRWAMGEGIPTRAAIVAMKRNESTIDETRHFLHGIGVQSVRVDRVRGVGRGASEVVGSDPLDELCGKCWSGKLCITGSGEIYPCIMARTSPVGHFDGGLEHVLAGDDLLGFRARVFSRKASTPRRNRLTDSYTSGSGPSPARDCTPQCGPDCNPSTCGPQECAPKK